MEEVSKICSNILREIVETAFKDAAETVDEVCDSILDILNLDSPGIYSDPKNPSALLVFGQRLPSLLRDNLPGRMCLICHGHRRAQRQVCFPKPSAHLRQGLIGGVV